MIQTRTRHLDTSLCHKETPYQPTKMRHFAKKALTLFPLNFIPSLFHFSFLLIRRIIIRASYDRVYHTVSFRLLTQLTLVAKGRFGQVPCQSDASVAK